MIRLSDSVSHVQVLDNLNQDVVIQAEDGDLAAIRMKNLQVVFVLERRDGQPNDPDPWRGYCHLPADLFIRLLKSAKGSVLSRLDSIQYFIANAAENDSTFDEVLFGNYVGIISREEAAEKLGFQWWE